MLRWAALSRRRQTGGGEEGIEYKAGGRGVGRRFLFCSSCNSSGEREREKDSEIERE